METIQKCFNYTLLLPIAIIVIIISPMVVFRFGLLRVSRIGSLAIMMEMYIQKKKIVIYQR